MKGILILILFILCIPGCATNPAYHQHMRVFPAGMGDQAK
jgi:hypothetical protein